MDPLAHTLVGATLAETRLKTWTTMATPMLIFSANAPDIDVVTMLIDRDLSLGFRRGWTHGVLALALLPIFMTGLILLLDRLVGQFRGRAPTARARPLLGLGYIAVWSHPVLDWLNTYGVRFLMPFDNTWFYGDALFIVDPWVWLLMGTTVVLAHSASRVNKAAWVVLGVTVTSLVTGFQGTPPAAKLLWCVGVTGIVWLRISGHWQRHLPQLAAVCLSSVTIYTIVMLAAAHLAESQISSWLAKHNDLPIEVMASPTPANPFRRDILVVDAEHYHFLELDWLRAEPIRISSRSIERRANDRITKAALAAPHVRGLATWIRFPIFVVKESDDGYRVEISDARYTRRAGSRLDATIVDLDRHLTVR